MKEFDLIVVGSGAGLLVLEAGLQDGRTCALVENGPIGGTCLNRGCIPTKILTTPADLLREVQAARRIGVSAPDASIDWDLLSERMWAKIGKNAEMEESLRAIPNLTLYRGTAEFTGIHRMRVRPADPGEPEEEIAGTRIVLATGARSVVPPIPGLKESGSITTETFFGPGYPRRPWPTLAVIGGGIIAAEFAHIFSAAGTKVSIVEMLPRLLPSEEPEVAALVESEFRKSVDIFLNKRAVAVHAADGRKTVVFEDVTTQEIGEVVADEVLVAVGRRSNSDLLKPETGGIKTDRHGWIEVDAYLETSQPGVWAIGDALGGLQFRHKANADAETLVRNLFGPAEARRPVDNSVVPWAIFTHPQIGHVGMTESEAMAKDHEIMVAVNHYSSIAKGYAMGYVPGAPDDGFVKVIVDKNGKILGAHVVGPEAALLVQPFVYMMNAGYVCPPPARDSNPRASAAEDDPQAMPGAPAAAAVLDKEQTACPEAGTYFPIDRSMVIHPSLNELTGWAFSMLKPVKEE
jgi:mycothione reductase